MEKKSQTKYIFITGGVVSSLGKGVSAASIGALLQSRGYKVHSRKFDPYLNVDPSQMSPLQHGEVYVTDDGHETDLDLGYYERFLNIKLSNGDSVSGGRVLYDVLTAERRGEYKGSNVQLIPHVSDKIKEYIAAPAEGDPDFMICEIGGTVGDIEGQIFLESVRQFANDIGRRNVMFVHLTLAPYIEAAGELKTKPTQMSVRRLLEAGIVADMLVVRTPRMLNDEERAKIGLFCNLPADNVISGMDMDSIYKIPLSYEAQGVATNTLDHFGLADNGGDISKLIKIVDYLAAEKETVEIAIVGKYFGTQDSYKSLSEALFHAGIANGVNVKIQKIDAEDLNDGNVSELLGDVKGVLVPGSFGESGRAGKIAARFARENNIPYLGICLGMQMAAVEFLQSVCRIMDAESCIPNESRLRIGAYPCKVSDGTLAHKIYCADTISERYRHRYKLNPKYANIMAEKGMIISGWSSDGTIPQIVEIPAHKFFIAGQFHPEFNSSPYAPHPLFAAFIEKAKR
jgi:CTP synthase